MPVSIRLCLGENKSSASEHEARYNSKYDRRTFRHIRIASIGTRFQAVKLAWR